MHRQKIWLAGGILIAAMLVLVAGCVKENRYSTYGAGVILYKGDAQVLSNCCLTAMIRMGADLKTEKNLDATPDVNSSSEGFSSSGQEKKTSHREMMAIRVDERDYRIEILQVDGYPAMVLLQCPTGDERLATHVTELFSNSRVKKVEKL
jgi:hypothetical protein